MADNPRKRLLARKKTRYAQSMHIVLSINALNKTYANGYRALEDVHLAIHKGEILALLGPNGAGKTTLISAVAGIVTPSSGEILVDGFDNQSEYRQTRKKIGLVPQEMTIGAFETVLNTVKFSRGLFGLKPDHDYIKQILTNLSLWDKRNDELRMLSGGMKRRVLIAKALAHQPEILFLDEPSAGVDVELRRDMWRIVEKLREQGVTVILTTHYIEEAEAIADRIAVMHQGKILLIEDKLELMRKLGKKLLKVEFKQAISELPEALSEFDITLSDDKTQLSYHYDARADASGLTRVINSLSAAGVGLKEVQTHQSSLEEIFVDLVQQQDATQANESERAS